MRDKGGFEGNAQTLRVLARLEKKELEPGASEDLSEDKRVGLNLTYRTLAAVLKYDNCIPLRRSESPLVRGTTCPKRGWLSEDEIFAHVTGIWMSSLPEASGGVAGDGALEVATYIYGTFQNSAQDGTARIELTSELVNEYVEGIDVDLDESVPPLSRVTLKKELRERVEVVKNLTYELVVNSPNLKSVKYCGDDGSLCSGVLRKAVLRRCTDDLQAPLTGPSSCHAAL